jgi:hypothetical protein
VDPGSRRAVTVAHDYRDYGGLCTLTMLTPNHMAKASMDEAIEHAMCADQDNDDCEGEGAAVAASAKRPRRMR